MRRHELVIFDWNGTLQDDLVHMYECGVQRIFRQFRLPCPTLDEYRHEVSSDYMRTFYRPRGIPSHVCADELNDIVAEGMRERGTRPALFPDADSFVRGLARRGYLVAVSSAFTRAHLDDAVAHHRLGPVFFRVDSDVRDKAESFVSIIDEAGVAAESCAVIGDTLDDLRGAVSIGARPYICTRGFHLPEVIEAERPNAPDLVTCRTLAELVPLFP